MLDISQTFTHIGGLYNHYLYKVSRFYGVL